MGRGKAIARPPLSAPPGPRRRRARRHRSAIPEEKPINPSAETSYALIRDGIRLILRASCGRKAQRKRSLSVHMRRYGRVIQAYVDAELGVRLCGTGPIDRQDRKLA